MKKDFITSLIAVAGCASVYTFPAVYIYLTNKDQFAVKTPLVLSVIFLLFAVMTLLVGTSVFLFRKHKYFQYVLVFPTALAVYGIIQYHFSSSFFPNYIKEDFALEDVLLLTIFNVFLLLAPFFAVYKLRKFVSANIRKISLVLIMTQLVWGFHPLVTHKEKLDNSFDFVDYTFSEQDKFTFGSVDNAIVLVVDSMGDDIAKEMFEKYPELQSVLKDFTMCDRLTSPCARTMYAVPEMLTGVPYPVNDNGKPDDIDHAGFLNRAFRSEHSVFQALKKQGFRTEGYSFFLQTICYAPDVIDNSIPVTEEIQKTSLQLILFTMLDKFSPVKSALSDGDFNLPFLNPQQAQESENTEEQTEIFDRHFYRTLSEKFSVGNEKKVFKYLHIHGAHDPVCTDEELRKSSDGSRVGQLRGSFKIVELLLDKLKQHSLYDNAAIIITGDHSEVYHPNTICFVKRRHQSRERMAVNSHPHRICDVAGTLLDEYGIASPLPYIARSEMNSDNKVSLPVVSRRQYADFTRWERRSGTFQHANEFISAKTRLEKNRILIEAFPDDRYKLAGFILRIINDDDAGQDTYLYSEHLFTDYFRYLRSDELNLPDGAYRVQLESVYGEFSNREDKQFHPVSRRILNQFLISENGSLSFADRSPVKACQELAVGKTLDFLLMKSYPMIKLPSGGEFKAGYFLIPNGSTLRVDLAPGEGGYVKFAVGSKLFDPCYLNVSACNGFKKRYQVVSTSGVEVKIPVGKTHLDEPLYVNFEFEIPPVFKRNLNSPLKIRIQRVSREKNSSEK